MEVRFDNPWGQELLFDHLHRLFWQFDDANNDVRRQIKYEDEETTIYISGAASVLLVR
jgi:hypothetical protein